MIPQISAVDMQNLIVQPFPSHTHRLGDKRIIGFADGLESIKQTVRHILSTERYAYAIYEPNYGVEMQQFIGANFGYVEANISRVITDALLQDDRIIDVAIDEIKQTNLDAVQVNFTVYTKLGSFAEGVSIGV